MPPLLRRGNFFENWQEHNFLDPLCILAKIQNGRHFRGEENFLKIAKSTLLRYPVGRKFRRNRSISHGLGNRHIYVFCYVAITQLLGGLKLLPSTTIPSKQLTL